MFSCGWLICNVTLTCVMCSFLFCREIVTGTGIAIIGVTAENVTFVEIGMVLLVMEALLPISEEDSILTSVASTLITSPDSQIVLLFMEALLPISGDDSILTAVASTTSPNSLID